jgi:hypothetical protein
MVGRLVVAGCPKKEIGFFVKYYFSVFWLKGRRAHEVNPPKYRYVQGTAKKHNNGTKPPKFPALTHSKGFSMDESNPHI